MKIFFSGGNGLTATPEALIPERKPNIMLSFHSMDSAGTRDRLKAYLKQGRNGKMLRKQIEDDILSEVAKRAKRKRSSK